MGKLEKLTKSIDKKKSEIEGYEAKIVEAREMLKQGRIDKHQFTRARLKYQEKVRGARATIHRKEKARLQFEKDEKEAREEKEKKAKEEEDKRKQAAREKEKLERREKREKLSKAPPPATKK